MQLTWMLRSSLECLKEQGVDTYFRLSRAAAILNVYDAII